MNATRPSSSPQMMSSRPSPSQSTADGVIICRSIASFLPSAAVSLRPDTNRGTARVPTFSKNVKSSMNEPQMRSRSPSSSQSAAIGIGLPYTSSGAPFVNPRLTTRTCSAGAYAASGPSPFTWRQT